ncbi:MAG: GntR family transcriptional regulator [Pseudomonadota bacterium]
MGLSTTLTTPGRADREAAAGTTEPAADGRQPANEQVYLSLRARLLEGALEPGASLTLRGVAASLGVSMTPAREAVRKLVAERALGMTGSGRILVPLPNASELEELFAARRLLEPELARRAAKAASKRVGPLLKALEVQDDALEAAIGAGDAQGYVRANTGFHATLYAAAEAPALMALVESIWLQTGPTMRRVYGVIGTRALQDFHETALAALSDDDPDGLARAIRDDVDQGAALAAEAAAL